MSRQIALPEERELPIQHFPTGHLRGFEKEIARIIELMSQQFENETLGQLNKGTIEKFEDQQVGNYANVFRKMSRRARRKILKRFSDRRISGVVRKTLLAANRQSQRQFYGDIENQIGISVQQLINEEGLSPQINALIIETEEWVKRLRDDSITQFTANTLRAMTLGESFEEVVNSYREDAEKRRNNARFVARNQLSNFNGISNKIRYQNLGITEAIWVTSRDERVRGAHADRNGKRFNLSEGLFSSKDGKTLIPGVDFNCRCIAKPIIPSIDNSTE